MLDVESDYIYISDDDFDCRMIRSAGELLTQIVSAGNHLKIPVNESPVLEYIVPASVIFILE